MDVRGLADSRVGVRAVRRKQNNQFLLALIEEEEEGLPELRYGGAYRPRVSWSSGLAHVFYHHI